LPPHSFWTNCRLRRSNRERQERGNRFSAPARRSYGRFSSRAGTPNRDITSTACSENSSTCLLSSTTARPIRSADRQSPLPPRFFSTACRLVRNLTDVLLENLLMLTGLAILELCGISKAKLREKFLEYWNPNSGCHEHGLVGAYLRSLARLHDREKRRKR